MPKNNKTPIFFIKSNDDWRNLTKGEFIVDINNDSYFGFRAMEKNAKNIIYNPNLIDSLTRIGKESKKFPTTTHLLLLDEKTLDFKAGQSEETFLKYSTRVIEKLLELNNSIKVDFKIKAPKLDEVFLKQILKKIYQNN